MNELEAQLYMLKGMISELTEEEQSRIKTLADEMRAVVAKDPELGTTIASLVAIETQVEQEKKDE